MKISLPIGLVFSLAGLAAPAMAQIVDSPYTITLHTTVSGLTSPVQAKPAPDGSGRLFIVDQAGTIRIVKNGVLLPTPFLDVTSLLVPLQSFYDERGLLSLAFHPDYAHNGRFFVHYTVERDGTSADPCFGSLFGCSSEVIAEFKVSQANPDVADPNSRVELLRVVKPQFNHAGGGMAIGPDGMLYFSFGDGGGANDGLADNPPSHGPKGNAQNTSVPLGKVLRYDISTPGVLTVPNDNPFAHTDGAFGGIYAYGLRNPYAFSFDDGPGGDGKLWLADVGQDMFEEVDNIVLGGDYGWPIKEGTHCFDPFNTTNPPPSCPAGDGMILPLVDYPHKASDGTAQGIAVIGGFVYRGDEMPLLRGKYLYGDLSTDFGVPDGHLFIMDPASPSMMRLKIAGNVDLGMYLKGFGRDDTGEIYVLATTELGPTGSTGVLMKMSLCGADFDGDGFVDFFDFNAFVTCFDGGACPLGKDADFNGDGFADFFDFNDFVTAFEAGC